MTTVAHSSELRRPGGGGLAARRPLIRWAWRLFRREWRQQILVIALLTVAVTSAVTGVTIAHNSGPLDYAEFGSANALFEFDGTDPRKLDAGLAAAEERFGTTDVIGHRTLPVPGSVDTVEFRAQNPRGPYAPLGLRRGSYPEGPGQVAVTDGVATLLGLEIGKTLALDGRRRTVVGVVENPRELSDEFALVSPSSAGAPDTVTVLVDTDQEAISAFWRAQGDRSAAVGSQLRGKYQPAPELAMFSVATVFMLLASLVAAAGFAVIAQRRLRQLGMLAAIGATEKHLRIVLLTNGAIVGAVGALIGTVAGLALWVAVEPTLEPALDFRLDRLSLPWALLAMIAVVAVLCAIAAAWWPGRAVARVPVTRALSARPPRPKPARHSAIVAVVLIAAGIGSLVLSDRSTPLLIIAGIVATILGTLLLGPLAIRLFARAAGNAPIAVRLALRDLARYQARSGAALAAITLALGIAATIVIIAAAEERKSAGEPPNLSARQIRVYTGATPGPEIVAIQTPSQLERMAARVRQLAADLDDAAVVPLHNPYQPGEPARPEGGLRTLHTEALVRKVADPENKSGAFICAPPPSGCYIYESRLYIATPALLRYLGIDPAEVEPNTDFLIDKSVRTDGLVTVRFDRATRVRGEPRLIGRAVTNVQRIDSRKLFGSPEGETGMAPTSFITLDGLRRRGWKQVPSGWLVEPSRPLTSEQVADSRELAAAGGLAIETRRESDSFTTLIAIATAAGALLALAILAMTVGLIRSESAGDLRTLTATGATSRMRRTLTAATAGGLAFLGALLGVAGAYLMLAATYHDKLDYLGRIPVLYLVLMVLGIPVAAAAAGWLLAGHEPPTIARAVIE
ncbi:MAG TPA: FtsX-like permease family protein [Gaiellaceae bacterium]|nr:FtsX-like permease family protein [Gaiellaceae bacterium]